MKAKVVSGAGHKRKVLGECLPLSMPFSLHIFPAHRCNLKCGYCLHSLPTDKINAKGFRKDIMGFELFKKCLDDAAHFPQPFKVLIFAGWGEPLIHSQISEMVKLAKQKNIAERIEIVTNGTLLTPALSKRLIDSGLDRIRISIQGTNSEMYRKMAGVDIDFEKLVDNIGFFYKSKKNTKVYIKTVSTAVPATDDQEKFTQIFGPISDEIAIEHIIPVIADIDHSKFGSKFNKRHCGGDAARVSVCPFPFYMSVIHPDGSYAPCCSPDQPLPLGNVGQVPITDLWKSSIINKFRVAHLEGQRGNAIICRTCPRPQYDIQKGDNLDAYSDQLLPFYKTNN